jgi:predicted AlkP superfamily phosphohydrolase/phosphomutase/tetratricopeptide (TPR) repeat protein
MGKKKLLLIGWDAADWKIIGPLLAKGQMPALKKMIDNGVYGNMSTMNPPYSPMLWSTVATGKTPDKHGVLGFIELMPDLKGVRPVTTNSRKSRAIWNILHNKGYKSNLVGWWPSYPAEPINGVVISDTFQKVSADPEKQIPLDEDAIHPKSMRESFMDLRMFPFEITKEHILPFIPQADKIDQNENKGLASFSKIMSHNVSLHNAATKLLRTSEWDFMAIYYDLIDHFCHNFMKFHPPKLREIPQDLYDIFKDTINGSYRFQDMMLERTLQLIDEDTTVIVMSDHGFESGHKRILDMPKVQAAPALEHRQFGMFVAMGPNIKKNEKVFGLGLIDVAPTILHHFGLPVGKYMDGKVMLDIFKDIKKPKYIESWEEIEGDFGELNKEESPSPSALSDQDAMEQLIELGYIERPDEKIEIAILKTKCDLKHNLARGYLGKNDFDRSKELLLELILEDDPIDTAPFYLDLLTISLKKEEYKKAEEYLNKIKESNTEVKYNLFFSEADILVGNGQLYKALEILEGVSVLKHNAEIWYKIGEIKYKLIDFEGAKNAFEKAISIESDRAKYHRAIAETYIELGDYEEAVEYALTSIELVKYYPIAHYVLGRALEKMGDLDNAKIAYETAESLQPQYYDKVRIAIENIEELNVLKDNEDKEYIYRENQIVIVSGLPRSGTSVMMQMLANGGLEILTDENRSADTSNPKGYYEYDPVMSIHKDNTWLDKGQNKGLKVVAPLLKYLNPKYRYKIIFMTRDLNEVVKSQQIMRRKDPDALPVKLFESYKKILKGVKVWANKEPGVELIYIDYKDVLNNVEDVVSKVTSFVGVDMNGKEMAKCVDKTLYRNKS